MKKIFQLIGISILLIVLPGASWYFLKSGLDYRKASMDKLDDYGPLPEADLILIDGKKVNTAYIDNRTIVLNGPSSLADSTTIMKLYRQFEKHPGIHFIFRQYPVGLYVNPSKENIWLLSDTEENLAFWKSVGLANEKYDVALIDFKGHIRNYYSLIESDQLRQMVEHTAFLLPVEETAKPIMQREQEK